MGLLTLLDRPPRDSTPRLSGASGLTGRPHPPSLRPTKQVVPGREGRVRSLPARRRQQRPARSSGPTTMAPGGPSVHEEWHGCQRRHPGAEIAPRGGGAAAAQGAAAAPNAGAGVGGRARRAVRRAGARLLSLPAMWHAGRCRRRRVPTVRDAAAGLCAAGRAHAREASQWPRRTRRERLPCRGCGGRGRCAWSNVASMFCQSSA